MFEQNKVYELEERFDGRKKRYRAELVAVEGHLAKFKTVPKGEELILNTASASFHSAREVVPVTDGATAGGDKENPERVNKWKRRKGVSPLAI